MGNQLIKDTNIEKEAIGNSGVNCQWEMHGGHKTDKNKTPVTVFLFDKKIISKVPTNSRDEFLATIRKEPQSLARFKHPNILSLIDPLLEDQRSMGFVTEAVRGSLLTFLNAGKVSEIFPTELDTKFHLLEIAETLSFLQNDVKSCHLGISPENVYVLANEKWKLGGFTFTTQILQGGMVDTNFDFQKPEPRITPSLKFSAPEVANFNSKCTFASDMFSFGCLIYTIYKVNHDKNTNNPYLVNATNVNGVQDFAREIYKQNMSFIPDQIRQAVIKMLNPEPSMRITITEFLNNPWFRDPFVQTVKHLETLYQKEFPQQQSFLKGLSQIILKFEKKFIMSKILPYLNNLIKNEQLSSSILPTYFKLIDNEGTPFLSKEEFQNIVWPSIKNLATGKQIPAQSLYLLVQNSHLFLDVGDIKEIQSVFVPLLTKSFECNVQKLQVLALQKTEALFSKIEYNISKSQILPRILNLCLDPNIQLRKEALSLLSKIYNVFDKAVINDQILTTLEKVRKLNNNYSINMTMLSIFEGISKNIGIEVIANKVLISMIPMLVDPNLSKPEYKAYLSTVHAYLRRIEEEQNKRYEGLPDQPPADALDEVENKGPAKQGDKVAGGEFEFFNAFASGGGSGSAEPQPNGGNSGGDFDFSIFEEQFGGASKWQGMQASGSTAPDLKVSDFNWSNQGDNQSGPKQPNNSSFEPVATNTKTLSSSMVIKSQNKPANQEAQPQGSLGNASGQTKGLKALGNPFNTGTNQTGQKQNTPAPTTFVSQNTQASKGPSAQISQQSGQNMFNNMKLNKPATTAQTFQSSSNQLQSQNKWDILDAEIPSGDSNFLGGMSSMSNQPPTYNTNTFGQSSNQFQFNGGINAPSQNQASDNLSGWNDIDFDLGMPSGGTNTINNNFGSSAPKTSFNQGGTNTINTSSQIGGLGSTGFGQNKFNQPKTGTQPFQKSSSITIQKNQNPIGTSDDFFESFNIKESDAKKTTPFNFGQKSQGASNNDLI